MTKKKLVITLAIGLPALLATGLLIFFLKGEGPAKSELIDAISSEIEAKCQSYARSKRYDLVYGLCQTDNLQLRIDDLSQASDEQANRFRAAMKVSCYAGLNGRVLTIDTLDGEEFIVSTYFLTDFTSQPDLRSTHEQLIESGRQSALTNICKGSEPVSGGGVRFTPLDWSDLSDPAEALAAINIGCAENTFRLANFGIVGLNCTSDIVALDLSRLTQRTEDALSNSFEYLDSCPNEIRMGMIRLSDDIYVMAAAETTGNLRQQLATSGQEKAEVVELCLGVPRN